MWPCGRVAEINPFLISIIKILYHSLIILLNKFELLYFLLLMVVIRGVIREGGLPLLGVYF